MAIDRIRAFNRFYTGKIGVIASRFLNSEYSLVQARLLYEIASHNRVSASDLAKKMLLTPDYLSKVIHKFERLGLIRRTRSDRDGRKQLLSPTPAGVAAYEELKARSNLHIRNMISGLDSGELQALISAMDTIEGILGASEKRQSLVTLRTFRPGDIGTVIHRHGVLYNREYGFNHEFDAYVAMGMAQFIQNISDRDCLWIAEIRGTFAGSIAIVRSDENTAQLRWLIVEPKFRGRGIGGQLVNEAVRFAKENGYQFVKLWTIDFLLSARNLYTAAGFRLSETKTSHVWGRVLAEECWVLDLRGAGNNP